VRDDPTPRSSGAVRRPAVPDDDLVAAARDGDRRALEQLLSAHRPRIVVICRRMLRDHADADDAAQEALVAIVRGIERFDGRSAFTTWSHRIATNVCLDELRRRGRRPQTEPGEFERLDGDQLDPADRATGSDDRRRLAAALDSLPDEFRLPVVLRDVADLDYSAIAEELGLAPGTVRSRIARGRARLAALLAQSTPLDPPSGNPTAAADVRRSEPT
jgi:RNA polymerase sigma-70 factor, ECF subfamily